jgi:hypothetical protein
MAEIRKGMAPAAGSEAISGFASRRRATLVRHLLGFNFHAAFLA